jgi:hypothetical protein
LIGLKTIELYFPHQELLESRVSSIIGQTLNLCTSDVGDSLGKPEFIHILYVQVGNNVLVLPRKRTGDPKSEILDVVGDDAAEG